MIIPYIKAMPSTAATLAKRFNHRISTLATGYRWQVIISIGFLYVFWVVGNVLYKGFSNTIYFYIFYKFSMGKYIYVYTYIYIYIYNAHNHIYIYKFNSIVSTDYNDYCI